MRSSRLFHVLSRTTKRSSRPSRRLAVEMLEPRNLLSTISLLPAADNTLYENPTGSLSNGLGQHLFAGATGQASNAIRRAMVKFDLSAVPAGSTINSATLTLTMSRTNDTAPRDTALHRLLADWGEGTSVAGTGGTGEGAGAPATTGDATWVHTFFNTQTWTNPGGDFVADPSAVTTVFLVDKYSWTGAGMTTDLQQWVDSPAANFGWILTGDETFSGSARQFDSKDNPLAPNRPVLTIDFTPPAPDLTVTKTHTGDFRQGQRGDIYTITVTNVGDASTTRGRLVSVRDMLPRGLIATSFVGAGWRTNLATLTATRRDVLAAGDSYPPLTLTVRVAAKAPASLTNSVRVFGGGELNRANNLATDPTTIIPVADLKVTKTHTGNFVRGDVGDVFTIIVSNVGVGSTVGTVTIKDILPAGLTATALAGDGWQTDLATLTATRSDVLASGSSYPALTLTVNVAANAPMLVINRARVSGGGELNKANDLARNPTRIVRAIQQVLATLGTATSDDRNGFELGAGL